MYLRLLIIIVSALFVAAGNGQNQFASKTFHVHKQVCHVSGTTEFDYLIQLREDSTIVYITYSSNHKTGYKTVIKEIYEGRYNESEGIVRAEFLSYNFLTKEKGNKSRLFQANQGFPASMNRVHLFTLKSDSLISANLLIPSLSKASPLKSDWLSAKFDGWQNKDILDKEIFGL